MPGSLEQEVAEDRTGSRGPSPVPGAGSLTPTRGPPSSSTCSARFSGTDLPGLFAAPARVPRPCWASGASLRGGGCSEGTL